MPIETRAQFHLNLAQTLVANTESIFHIEEAIRQYLASILCTYYGIKEVMEVDIGEETFESAYYRIFAGVELSIVPISSFPVVEKFFSMFGSFAEIKSYRPSHYSREQLLEVAKDLERICLFLSE